jgi:excisionase family DNA binding protein
MTSFDRINVPPRLGCITAQALARELDISTRTLRRWVQTGALPAPRRLGRSVLWSVDAIREAILRKQGGNI